MRFLFMASMIACYSQSTLAHDPARVTSTQKHKEKESSSHQLDHATLQSLRLQLKGVMQDEAVSSHDRRHDSATPREHHGKSPSPRDKRENERIESPKSPRHKKESHSPRSKNAESSREMHRSDSHRRQPSPKSKDVISNHIEQAKEVLKVLIDQDKNYTVFIDNLGVLTTIMEAHDQSTVANVDFYELLKSKFPKLDNPATTHQVMAIINSIDATLVSLKKSHDADYVSGLIAKCRRSTENTVLRAQSSFSALAARLYEPLTRKKARHFQISHLEEYLENDFAKKSQHRQLHKIIKAFRALRISDNSTEMVSDNSTESTPASDSKTASIGDCTIKHNRALKRLNDLSYMFDSESPDHDRYLALLLARYESLRPFITAEAPNIASITLQASFNYLRNFTATLYEKYFSVTMTSESSTSIEPSLQEIRSVFVNFPNP